MVGLERLRRRRRQRLRPAGEAGGVTILGEVSNAGGVGTTWVGVTDVARAVGTTSPRIGVDD